MTSEHDAEWEAESELREGRQDAYNGHIQLTEDLENGEINNKFVVSEPKDRDHKVSVYCQVIASHTDPVRSYKYIEILSKASGLPKKIISQKVKVVREYRERKEREKILNMKGILKIDNYLENVKIFHKKQPFFYDKARIFWFWDKSKFCYQIVDDTDVMNMLEKELGFQGQTVSNMIKNNYLEAFKRVGRENIPSPSPKDWIQFKNKVYSLNDRKLFDVKSNYFFTNPIPWEIGESSETPTIDKLFSDWVGEDRRILLYELIAYCCYLGYPIQLLFCLWGNGRNGKSQFLKILEKFVGHNNTTTTELDILTSNRFESFKLYKKLICTIGETNFGLLQSSSLIKKLVGGDRIGFEKKNKDPFDDYNYAKIIIASNSLPSSQDTSDGFYRRWLIIGFEREFEEIGREVWEDVPDQEYTALAKKITEILPNLLETGVFTNQGTILERKEKYISVSNPLSLFIEQHCFKGDSEFVLYSKLYTAYIHYLQLNKRRRVTRKEFKEALEDEGFYQEKTTKTIKKNNGDNNYLSGYWVEGLNLKSNSYDSYDDYANISTSPLYIGIDIEEEHNCHIHPKSKNEEIVHDDMQNIIHLPCHICMAEPSHFYETNGKPICSDCKKSMEVNKNGT